MDIFVEDGAGFQMLCDYVGDAEGYTPGEEKGRIGYVDIDINKVRSGISYTTCSLQIT